MKLATGAVLAAVLAFVAGCGNDTGNPQLGLDMAKRVTAKLTGKDKAAPPPTADQIRAAVTPEFRAQNGNLPMLLASSVDKPIASLMFQTGQNGDVRTYLTPDAISFSLRQGVLVASRGLGADLMQADVTQVLPRVLAGSGQAQRVHVYLDSEDQEVRRSFTCSYARAEGQVVETCRGDGTGFENRYVLRGGRIVTSVQWVSPLLGSFRLEDLG